MKKLVIFMLSLLFAFAVPVLSMAQETGHPMEQGMHSCKKHMGEGRDMDGKRGDFGEMGMAKMFRLPWFYLAQKDELKLSDEQVASLKKISFDLKKDLITKGADVKVKRLELSELLTRPDYKLEDATAKLKEVADARLALATAMLQYSVQARDVLTPDQLKSVKDIHRHGCDGKSCGKEMKEHLHGKDKKK